MPALNLATALGPVNQMVRVIGIVRGVLVTASTVVASLLDRATDTQRPLGHDFVATSLHNRPVQIKNTNDLLIFLWQQPFHLFLVGAAGGAILAGLTWWYARSGFPPHKCAEIRRARAIVFYTAVAVSVIWFGRELNRQDSGYGWLMVRSLFGQSIQTELPTTAWILVSGFIALSTGLCVLGFAIVTFVLSQPTLRVMAAPPLPGMSDIFRTLET